jgi:hypothetical protein
MRSNNRIPPRHRVGQAELVAALPVLHLPAHWPWQAGWKTLWDTVIGHCYATAQRAT